MLHVCSKPGFSRVSTYLNLSWKDAFGYEPPNSSEGSRATKFNGLQVFVEMEVHNFADFSWFVSLWHQGNK